MAGIRETQLRLVYSLLRIAVRVSARFRIPMRTMAELLRLAYFEVLRKEGLTQGEIGRRMGQTDRHMRSLAQRLRSDFFAAEREVGIVREVEAAVAQHTPTLAELRAALPLWSEVDVQRSVTELLQEKRITLRDDGRYEISAHYALLASDQFHRRIDALNEYLDGVHQAIMHRLVYDEKQTAMIKTITFRAEPAALEAFITRVEGELRREVAALDEQAQFEGGDQRRFTLGLTLAPTSDAHLDR